jgi:hypothetical protein
LPGSSVQINFDCREKNVFKDELQKRIKTDIARLLAYMDKEMDYRETLETERLTQGRRDLRR